MIIIIFVIKNYDVQMLVVKLLHKYLYAIYLLYIFEYLMLSFMYRMNHQILPLLINSDKRYVL